MYIQALYDGLKTYISQKSGAQYADIFLRGVDSKSGDPDMEQLKLRTFDEKVIKTCQQMKTGEIVNFDITIREGLIEGVELYA